MWSHLGFRHSLFRFHTAPSDYLWRYAFSIIPLYRGRTVFRLSCCCTSCENLTWHEANVSSIEAVHFTDLSERFSTNVRDVHPEKTVGICPWKQLQESVCCAVCVDTCSDPQMWPDSQSAGVSVELDFTLSFGLFGSFSFFPLCSEDGKDFPPPSSP